MPNASLGKAYTRAQHIGGNPRATEARAFMEAARRLSEAQKVVADAPDAYRSALRLNWRLWTIIQSDVSGPDNRLPPDLKANVISLSIFVDKHTLNALAEPSARMLDVLININRNLAAGLMSSPDDVGATAEPALPSRPTPSAAESIPVKGNIVT